MDIPYFVLPSRFFLITNIPNKIVIERKKIARIGEENSGTAGVEVGFVCELTRFCSGTDSVGTGVGSEFIHAGS